MLTQEQQDVVDAVNETTDKIITVQAKAGTGKSRTSKAVVEFLKPKTGFYTAFNKGIVEDSSKDLHNLIESKTFHALAYKYIRPSRPITCFSYHDIKEDLPYSAKKFIIESLDEFYRSSFSDLEAFLEEHCYQIPELHSLIIEYADAMLNNKVNPTFNYMLKCLHLMLLNGDISIDLDMIIYDEVQDCTAVTLEIFKLINAKKKLILGDKFQNIYSYMNTVNGFDLLTNTRELNLTKSFRCNPVIAEDVQSYGRKWLDTNFQFTGNENLTEEEDGSIVYLSRTNSAMIERMAKLLQTGQSFSTIRSIDDIFTLPITLIYAASGKPVSVYRYKYLEREYLKFTQQTQYTKFFEYCLRLNIEELSAAITALRKLSDLDINIFDLKNKAKEMKANKNIILSTTHAFKGLEMSTAVLDSGMAKSIKSESATQQDFNLYYVAMTRAKNKLIK